MKRQPSGVPWFAAILACVVCAWPMQLLEAHAHMQRGIAFLACFPL